MNRIDPWFQIVSGLHGRGRFAAQQNPASAGRGPRERCSPMITAMANASSIRRIEWQTTCTILVTWSDSTLGRFEDQTWRAGFARTSGICGLTGVPVRRGDPVFRPLQRAGVLPRNAFDMIRADTLGAPTSYRSNG
ncbi:DUF3331 domain-containing protein [Paraburkholderia hospita]|jgi:hypothetical protein|uniref:DUF3331 domain-containing protein n=1 Tax=Paraburkholderia hospita TaxID=169430 RepID=A0AAJ4VPI1_9BURK|nr:DUF3331 domain-containing protein [Paraburkholderia hospita]SKC96090.1 protein of unknown function [Burkholderia sp. CF099]SOE89958.1 protein of unknown function [Burkholderia sp. YR290]AUT75052.1 DUF3331 domain-containing protein [Paraburkholderia hospita]AXF04677.1 DUF3331 domain-containing protein [Paraburkholderia hospita]EIM93297.1 hypothetical protein WQE_51005 [Paraburkholderia hospita]